MSPFPILPLKTLFPPQADLHYNDCISKDLNTNPKTIARGRRGGLVLYPALVSPFFSVVMG